MIHATDNHGWYNPPNSGQMRQNLGEGWEGDIFLCHELGFENQVLSPLLDWIGWCPACYLDFPPYQLLDSFLWWSSPSTLSFLNLQSGLSVLYITLIELVSYKYYCIYLIFLYTCAVGVLLEFFSLHVKIDLFWFCTSCWPLKVRIMDFMYFIIRMFQSLSHAELLYFLQGPCPILEARLPCSSLCNFNFTTSRTTNNIFP